MLANMVTIKVEGELPAIQKRYDNRQIEFNNFSFAALQTELEGIQPYQQYEFVPPEGKVFNEDLNTISAGEQLIIKSRCKHTAVHDVMGANSEGDAKSVDQEKEEINIVSWKPAKELPKSSDPATVIYMMFQNSTCAQVRACEAWKVQISMKKNFKISLTCTQDTIDKVIKELNKHGTTVLWDETRVREQRELDESFKRKAIERDCELGDVKKAGNLVSRLETLYGQPEVETGTRRSKRFADAAMQYLKNSQAIAMKRSRIMESQPRDNYDSE